MVYDLRNLYTTKELMDKLNVTAPSLFQWRTRLSENNINAVTISGGVYYTKEMLLLHKRVKNKSVDINDLEPVGEWYPIKQLSVDLGVSCDCLKLISDGKYLPFDEGNIFGWETDKSYRARYIKIPSEMYDLLNGKTISLLPNSEDIPGCDYILYDRYKLYYY